MLFFRDENTGQSSSKPKKLKQKDSESEAIKSNELVKDGSNNKQTNVNIRNKVFTYSDYFIFRQEIYENFVIL